MNYLTLTYAVLKSIHNSPDYSINLEEWEVMKPILESILEAWPLDHWYTISDRFDLQVGIIEDTNEYLISLYPVINIDGLLQTDTSNWLDLFRSKTI